MSQFDLSGKVAVVTGGNGGIGLGMARGLAGAGATIVVAGRDTKKNAEAVDALSTAGARAIAQTKMTINQRAMVDGLEVDVVCTGRFYDFFEKRGDRWAIVRRQPIYEKDRMDPVEPSRRLMLDVTLLNRFPEGYRHLAYLQSRNGFTIKDGLPGVRDARRADVGEHLGDRLVFLRPVQHVLVYPAAGRPWI